ncbi:MAG: DUF4340 domain-containing protein [Lachnospiraceae bacterium]
MKKKGIPLLICVVCLILLCVGYVFLKNYNKEAEEANADSAPPILDLKNDDVISVKLTMAEGEETFKKEDDVWILESDASFQVDEGKVTSLLSSILGMTASRTLSDATGLEECGLDQPAQTVEITDADGKIYTICWGNTNDMTGDDYVYIKEDEKTIYTVDGSIQTGIDVTLENYRQAEEETEENTEE